MFGKRLAELRKKKGLSQYELAELLRMTRGQIANYEQGKRQPAFEILKIFADYFSVSTDYLVGHTDDPTPHQTKKQKPEDLILAAHNEGGDIDMDKLQEIIEDTVQKILERRKKNVKKGDNH